MNEPCDILTLRLPLTYEVWMRKSDSMTQINI
jgi:hypothetical protein